MGLAGAAIMGLPMHKAQNSDGHDRVQRFLARAYSRSTLPYLAMGVLLAITIVVVGRELEHHIDGIELWLANLGPWSVFAFIGLFVIATSLLLPETVLAIVAGALFGLRWGMAAVVAGSLLAAALQYLLSQHLLRTQIQRAIAARPALAAIQQAVNRDAFRLQVLLRLTPLNPATISYLLGAADVRFSGFLLACLALIPNMLIEVYAGHAGKHIALMAGHDGRAVYLHDLAILGSLAVCVIVVVLMSRMARKAVLGAVGTPENTEQPDRTPLR